jgi:predicted transposase YdaD
MLYGIRGIEESSVYQGILRQGEARGEARGHLDEARNNLLSLGRRKLGPPSDDIAALNDLARLRALLGQVLDVATWDELLPPDSET